MAAPASGACIRVKVALQHGLTSCISFSESFIWCSVDKNSIKTVGKLLDNLKETLGIKQGPHLYCTLGGGYLPPHESIDILHADDELTIKFNQQNDSGYRASAEPHTGSVPRKSHRLVEKEQVSKKHKKKKKNKKKKKHSESAAEECTSIYDQDESMQSNSGHDHVSKNRRSHSLSHSLLTEHQSDDGSLQDDDKAGTAKPKTIGTGTSRYECPGQTSSSESDNEGDESATEENPFRQRPTASLTPAEAQLLAQPLSHKRKRRARKRKHGAEPKVPVPGGVMATKGGQNRQRQQHQFHVAKEFAGTKVQFLANEIAGTNVQLQNGEPTSSVGQQPDIDAYQAAVTFEEGPKGVTASSMNPALSGSAVNPEMLGSPEPPLTTCTPRPYDAEAEHTYIPELLYNNVPRKKKKRLANAALNISRKGVNTKSNGTDVQEESLNITKQCHDPENTNGEVVDLSLDGGEVVDLSLDREGDNQSCTHGKVGVIPHMTQLELANYPLVTTGLSPSALISFKMLEMSDCYSPEVSLYKVGTVMSVDNTTITVHVHYGNEAAQERKASGRFELRERRDEEEDVQGCADEVPTDVDAILELDLSELIEPRLISHHMSTPPV